MPTYRAAAPIYLCRSGRLIAAGETFASDDPPGLQWVAIKPRVPAATAPARRTKTARGK